MLEHILLFFLMFDAISAYSSFGYELGLLVSPTVTINGGGTTCYTGTVLGDLILSNGTMDFTFYCNKNSLIVNGRYILSVIDTIY